MIYVVSGFMRSGTSMMMECLEAGGMEVAWSQQRNWLNKHRSDDLYSPNPNGLYELEINELASGRYLETCRDKLVKFVVPWLRWLQKASYKTVFMLRDSEEIRQSCEASFGLRLKAEAIERRVEKALHLLRFRKDVQLQEVQYKDVLENPLSVFSALDWPIDASKAAEKVDATKYRFRLERLTVGI